MKNSNSCLPSSIFFFGGLIVVIVSEGQTDVVFQIIILTTDGKDRIDPYVQKYTQLDVCSILINVIKYLADRENGQMSYQVCLGHFVTLLISVCI